MYTPRTQKAALTITAICLLAGFYRIILYIQRRNLELIYSRLSRIYTSTSMGRSLNFQTRLSIILLVNDACFVAQALLCIATENLNLL